MSGSKKKLSSESLPVTRAKSRMGRPRVVTMELARRFAEAMLGDISHSIESASHEVGLNPNTVRDCIGRYERDACETDEDEEICGVLAAARAKHIYELRKRGEVAGGDANGPGVAWYKWRLETQAPKEHPRKEAVELTGKDGGPIETAAVQYVVAVPEEEPDQEP